MFKVYDILSTTGTIGTVSGSGTSYTATISVGSITNFINGQVIVATDGTGSLGSGVVKVTSVGSNSINVLSTGIMTPGTITDIYANDTNATTFLQNYLNTTSSVQGNSLIVAEWNLNIAQNINTIANYYNTPSPTANTNTASMTYVLETSSTSSPTWYGATDAKILINGGATTEDVNGNPTPIAFTTTKQKTKYLFSLEDCFGKFRPRSGINKAVWFDNRKINYGVGDPSQYNTAQSQSMSGQYSNRPRYYMPDSNDQFKYWSSFRTAISSNQNIEKGISSYTQRVVGGVNRGYIIEDAAPFVVYGDTMATNRIVVKMQTNVGSASFENITGVGNDSFYGLANQTTPKSWRVDYLAADGVTWNTAWTAPIGYNVPVDGCVELGYGLNIPTIYQNSFYAAGKYSSAAYLPINSIYGYAYLVESLTSAGTYYIWTNNTSPITDESGASNVPLGYSKFSAQPSWFVIDSTVTATTPYVTQVVGTAASSPDPSGRVSNFPQYSISGTTSYREFQYINGLRIVVDTMNRADTSFDLIELSARLAVDLTDKTSSVNIKKSASDLGQTGLPVGQLLVSTGSLSLFDYDKAFSDNNSYSLISKFALNSRYKPIRKMRIKPPKKSKSSSSYIQVKVYDVIRNINNSNYYIPIKTMYVDGFPEIGAPNRTVVINLRDLYFYFESMTAPQLFIPDCSLSFAITTLMDSIGFSNYIFKMSASDKDPVIPFFFIQPNTTVAQVLNDLAVSFQAAMFLDETNNLVVMYKNYLLPSLSDRSTDITLYGSDDSHTNGVVKNSQTYDITSISKDGTYVTYVCNNNFVTNQMISIFGAASSSYNVTNAVVYDATSTQFRIVSSANGTTSTAKAKISPAFANITDIKTEQDRVFNDGKITYATRYIQKTSATVGQQYLQDKDVFWKYKPVLLWEIAAPQDAKPANEQVKNQSGYALTAIPLNSDLTNSVPTVVSKGTNILNNGVDTGILDTVIINNIIDFGESIYWMPRYNGYFYANGEMIKYDAVQYSVTGIGIVWISSVQDYQNYFSQLPFGGQIYPTGLVRIFADPYYELLFSDADKTLPIYDSVTGIQLVRLQLGDVSKHGRCQFGTGDNNSDGTLSPKLHSAGINSYWTNSSNVYGCVMDSRYLVNSDNYGVTATSLPSFNKVAGKGTSSNVDNFARKTKISGIIKNILSAANVSETASNNYSTTIPGNVQASALVMDGAKPNATITPRNPMDFISYIVKPLGNEYKHVGTRMRIIGEVKESNANYNLQSPAGAVSYYSGIGAASGGLAIGVNPNTNFGYYFEIAALTDSSINKDATGSTVNNVFFYKIGRNPNSGTTDATAAIPQLLFTGLTNILVDDGNFAGQARFSGEDQVTVYDLAIEHETQKLADGNLGLKFYLYINDKLIATVVDTNPLLSSTTSKTITNYQNVALFIRGNSRLMFENLYAITSNYGDNNDSLTNAPLQATFNLDNGQNVNVGFRKYSTSNAIRNSYLLGLHPSEHPKYQIYYEEFGTIMREAAYINAKYDKAYPALTAKIAPTFNDIQGYVVAGFTANAYDAEFLIINTTDTVLSLDDTSGNFLRIQGVTFTQEAQNQLTVDDFFSKKTNFSDPQRNGSGAIDSPYALNATYTDIKNSRMTFGKNAFNLDAPYIQNQDTAYDMMEWIAAKIMQPRFAIGLSVYGNPMVQLGDIVEIQYNTPNEIALDGTRFVVYSIQYDRDNTGPNMILYLTEVTA